LTGAHVVFFSGSPNRPYGQDRQTCLVIGRRTRTHLRRERHHCSTPVAQSFLWQPCPVVGSPNRPKGQPCPVVGSPNRL
jgi:hypothetical protein